MINNLKYFRLMLGYSQLEVAEMVDCSRNTISSIERDEFMPSLRLAFRLADVLNVQLKTLFDFSDECRIFNVDVAFTECDICPNFECFHCKLEVN